MTNEEMARAYLAQAAEIIIEVENLYRRQVWNLAVRRAQEVVELTLKGVLWWIGLEVPRAHDVGIWLKTYREKFPQELDIDRLASISRRLRREREVSFYGDEEVGASPQALYAETDAQQALQEAKWVFEQCQGLLPRVEGTGRR